jgi:hypothetical protein
VVAIAREAERVNRAADALEHAIAHGAYAGRLEAAQIVLHGAGVGGAATARMEMAREAICAVQLV